MDKIISCIKCQKTFIVTVQMQYIYYCKNFSLPKALPSMPGGTEEEQKKRSRISTEKDYAKSE